MKESSLTVNYVSLPPGSGKTRAAIEMMTRHLTGTLQLKRRPRYIFYVAATKLLLNQTAANLLSAFVPKQKGKRDLADLHAQLSDNPETRHLAAKLRIAYSEEDFGAQAGVSVQKQVQNILDGRSNDGKRDQPLLPGTVLFITHEAFLKLSAQHAKLYGRTLVLFDEARKWAAMMDKIYMDSKAERYFNSMFNRVQMRDGWGKVVTGIDELTPKPLPENQKVSSLKGHGKNAARAFGKLDELHSLLTITEGSPRRVRAYSVLKKSTAGNKILMQINLPSFPFTGFHSVYILSADFTTSQTYYFLKEGGTQIVSKSEWFMDTFHPRGYEAAIKRATDRYKYVDIVALNADQQPPAIGKYRTGGLMIPCHRVAEIGDLMQHWGMSGLEVMAALARVRSAAKTPPTEVDRGINKILKDLGAQTDMLAWMVEKSQAVVKAWRKKNPSDAPALMFLNSEFQDKAEVDSRTFVQLNHAQTVGDNRHRDSNAVVFLVSLNPDLRMKQLLEARLGHLGYNVEDDFVVDRLIQASGRGNIRVPKIQDRMLIVVSTEYLAMRLVERLKGSPTYHAGITQKLGNYMSWDYRRYVQSKIEEEDPKRARRLDRERRTRLRSKREKRTMTQDEKKRERALYQAAYRAKQDGNIKLYSKLEQERDALRFVNR